MRVRQERDEGAPLQRYATPTEIAPRVASLVSDAASHTSGAVLLTDWGNSLP